MNNKGTIDLPHRHVRCDCVFDARTEKQITKLTRIIYSMCKMHMQLCFDVHGCAVRTITGVGYMNTVKIVYLRSSCVALPFEAKTRPNARFFFLSSLSEKVWISLCDIHSVKIIIVRLEREHAGSWWYFHTKPCIKFLWSVNVLAQPIQEFVGRYEHMCCIV